MIERRVKIGASSGLRARPAAMFVQKVTELSIPVTIAKDGKDPVDARSIMLVLAQNIASGDEVVIATTAAGAEPDLENLSAFLARDLDALGHA
jgi:phosphocarrier protein